MEKHKPSWEKNEICKYFIKTTDKCKCNYSNKFTECKSDICPILHPNLIKIESR